MDTKCKIDAQHYPMKITWVVGDNVGYLSRSSFLIKTKTLTKPKRPLILDLINQFLPGKMVYPANILHHTHYGPLISAFISYCADVTHYLVFYIEI